MKKLLLFLAILLPYFTHAQFVPPKELISSYGRIHSLDVNNDQLDDLILNFSSLLFIYQNLGNGEFKEERDTINTSANLKKIEPIDFDKDGDMDFLGVSSRNIYLYTINLTFKNSETS